MYFLWTVVFLLVIFSAVLLLCKANAKPDVNIAVYL